MNFEPFTFVLERVGQLLVDEIKFLSTDTKKLFQRLQQQLELAQSFVKDAEEEKEKAAISNVLETEIQHIMQILPQIEDFLDTLHLEDVQKIQQPSSIRKFMACFTCSSNPLVHRHVVIDTANQLIVDLEDTRKRAEPYQRQSSIPQVSMKIRPLIRSQPNIMNEEFIVGLDEDVETLVPKLKGTDGERTSILAVAGMGGSGKTTLTRMLYNHEEIKGHFTGRLAWVCVSQEWDTAQLLREMSSQLHVPLIDGEFSTVRVSLQEFFQRSSCLVVLDDVWDMEALRQLLPLLLPGGGRKGNGKILITTRNEEILHFPGLGGVYIHQPRALTPEQSWDLFSKIIRNGWQEIRGFDEDSVFAKSARKMLERCYGLPLAIVALAGLLSTKGSIQEWRALENRVSSTILRENKGFHDYGAVMSMLELSYLDLPYNLKPCFLYLGIYPEDSEIGVDELTQLWIGEGLIRSDLCSEGQTLEELGMDFVVELVQRCMAHVVSRLHGEKVRSIRVHDLMRDICLKKAEESGFFKLASQSTIPSNSEKSLSRRAIVHSDWKLHSMNISHLRSVIKLSHPLAKHGVLQIAYREMRLLRVLHLTNVGLGDTTAQEIGSLTLLRYLHIQECEGVTTAVLEAVKRLINLLTFVLVGVDEVRIPNNMVGSMKQLRHLRVVFGWVQSEESMGVGGSRSLQCLESRAGEWLSKELPAASFLFALRVFSIVCIKSQVQLDAIYNFVGNSSNHLRSLFLQIDEKSGLALDLQGMKLERCPLLEDVLLWGCVRSREEDGPFFFPPNLLCLYLVGSKIEITHHLEKAITQLHQLRSLILQGRVFEGDKLTMTGLLQLQQLQLLELPNLREWIIEERSLPQLKEIEIRGCSRLGRIPEGISGIHNLQRFHAWDMPASFYKRLEKPSEMEDRTKAGGGEDFHLICHVPDVKISKSKFYYPESPLDRMLESSDSD